MEVLNLYACLGGNRYKWGEVCNVNVTAVESDPELARLYKLRFPNDTVIIGDAHQYLLRNYKRFAFIWGSPPCPSHSIVRAYNKKASPLFPDLKLYEEIVFLKTFYKGLYVVENVVPYYTPLVPAQKRGRHLFWSNFIIPQDLKGRKSPVIGKAKNEIKALCKFHKIDLSDYQGTQRKDKIARNLVDFDVGKTIFEKAVGVDNANKTNQLTLFK
jgi:DNA (cytosine-5)-methyltransferase 1